MGSARADDSVSIDSVSSEDGSATVSGTASLAPITEPQSVGGDNVNFDPAEVGEAAGINLVDAKIFPLADGTGLRFIWVLNSLPPQIPPEGVRYTWSFKIGTSQYQLQAKRTNLASVTTLEAPLDHIQQLQKGEFFQLRGACTSAYLGTPVSGCFHLAFLKGGFDMFNEQVSIDLPFNTKDAIGRLVAPDFLPGVVIDENITAGMSINAAFQAVIGNTSTSDYTNGWTPFFVGPRVDLGVSVAAADPEVVDYRSRATLSPDGSFSGTVSGLAGKIDTVFARACNGETCVYASAAV